MLSSEIIMPWRKAANEYQPKAAISISKAIGCGRKPPNRRKNENASHHQFEKR